MARLAVAGALAALSAVAETPGHEPRAWATAPPCTVRFLSVRFRPSTVARGSTTRLHATIANCASTVEHVTDTVFGREPCAVLDPVAHPVTLPARGRVRETVDFEALSCPGTASVTTRLADAQGHPLAVRTATFTIA